MIKDLLHLPITVLGAGRWGTAMAIYLSRLGYHITLQCHTEEELQYLKQYDASMYLTDFSCNNSINFTSNINEAVQTAKIIIIAVPVPYLRNILQKINQLPPEVVLVGINKGIERGSFLTVPEILIELFPHHTIAHLGGPCFPQGLLSKTTPVAETLGCKAEKTSQFLQQIFSSPTFRVYRSQDLKGVAITGALKNVFAIAAGIIHGAGFYEEALSVLVTRGLAEMRRICKIMQISDITLYGLSGLGDLVLTCYSPSSSQNKNFGIQIGQGKSISEILQTMQGKVAEGYYTTQAIWEWGQKYQANLPLIKAIYQVLYLEQNFQHALKELMQRPLKEED